MDDGYSYYILKPVDGRYTLLDYLINTIIQNLDSIELISGKMDCSYDRLRKRICINKEKIFIFSNAMFNNIKSEIDKDKYLELYYKNVIYHEIEHMFHYKLNSIKANTVYVPADYMSLSEFPPLKKRMSLNAKKVELGRRKSRVKLRAKERIKKRISLYMVLSNKYNVLNPDEIDNCDIAVEEQNMKYEEIMLPPVFFRNPVEEAFSECDAQIYSGIFENNIFNEENSEKLKCFYLPIDKEHVIMTYVPSSYSFSASIGFALKECISKLSYFRTVFLGKNDLFLEFLGEYEFRSVNEFSRRLISADKGQMNEVQPLLDYIVNFFKSKEKSLENLNIFFPLVHKDNKWVYYTEVIDKSLKLVKDVKK